jgi:hypothetical protein
MLYVRFLGGAAGVLLALILLADAYLPQPATAPSGTAGFDHQQIRITAAAKGPERVVIDTSVPTTSVTTTSLSSTAPAGTAAVNENAASSPQRVREALAAISAGSTADDLTVVAPTQKDVGKDARHAHRAHRRVVASRAPASDDQPHYYYSESPQQQPSLRRPPQFAGNFFGLWLR